MATRISDHSYPRVNVGTIGHVDHGRSSLSLSIAPPLLDAIAKAAFLEHPENALAEVETYCTEAAADNAAENAHLKKCIRRIETKAKRKKIQSEAFRRSKQPN